MNAADIESAATGIRRYFLEHPAAADTLEGVAVFWLQGNMSDECLTTVRHAVGQLLLTGEISKRILADGTAIYERRADGSSS